MRNDVWVRLSVRLAGGGAWVEYRDDEGTVRTVDVADGRDWHSRWLPVRPPAGLVATMGGASGPTLLGGSRAGYEWRVPVDLAELVVRAIGRVPTHRPGIRSLLPLAVFVDPPPSLAGLRWESWIPTLAAPLAPGRVRTVRLARTRWKRRSSFRLPLRILAVGDRASAALEGVRQASWFREDPDVQSHGIVIHEVPLPPSPLREELRRAPYDVVLVDERGIETVLAGRSVLPKGETQRPRLIVFLDQDADQLHLLSLPIPAGTSLLWVPIAATPGAQFMREFLYAVIHDAPLHEAVHEAGTVARYDLADDPLLAADPETNQALRMSDALAEFRNEAFRMDKLVALGDHRSFVTRLEPSAVASTIARHLDAAAVHRAAIDDAVGAVENLRVDFQRETHGLVPLAKAHARIELAQVAQRAVSAELAALTRDPAAAELLAREQRRRVDISIDRLDETGYFRPMKRDAPVIAGGRHRLCVYIGQPLAHSIMEGEPPAIDPLLPDPESAAGHVLDVAVYAKRFTLRSPSVQRMRLPRFGGSEPVFFDVDAPEQEGLFDMRVSVFHGNHLLQSFRFETIVARSLWPDQWLPPVEDDELPPTPARTRTRLDFTQTARFSNIDQLRPRALSIGANADSGGGTHSFMIKKDGVAPEAVQLTSDAIGKCMKDFRALIERAAVGPGRQPRFPANVPPGSPIDPAFDDVIRDLADFGYNARQILLGPTVVTKQLRGALRQIRESANLTIQVVRHDANYAFPWSVLYDYPLPTRVKNAPPARVCRGVPFPEPPPPGPVTTRTGRGCPHNPDEDVYCIHGFWGIRHRVEQLMRTAAQDAVLTVDRPPAAPGVCIALGEEDAPTRALAKEMRSVLGPGVHEVTADEVLLDLLWEPDKRPALLIVLGHLETVDKPGEPIGPRIITAPKSRWTVPIPAEKWLQPRRITDYHEENDPWEDQPRPIVLLLACSSAATDLETVNDFVKSFAAAGAAAVLGTECTTFSGLAARLAREIIADLWDGKKSLGDAVQGFSTRLIAAGNPLPFAFSYCGNADLRVVP